MSNKTIETILELQQKLEAKKLAYDSLCPAHGDRAKVRNVIGREIMALQRSHYAVAGYFYRFVSHGPDMRDNGK